MTIKNKIHVLFWVGLVALYSCNGPDLPKTVLEAYADLPDKIDFNKNVKPILSDKCFICHGPDKAKIKAGLQLHDPEFAYAELKDSPGKFAIKPKKTGKSELVARILSSDPEYVMPSPDSHLTLTDLEKATLIKWIEQGAEYKEHWAFLKPQMPKIPKTKNKALVANPIDNFVLERLQKEQLEPSKKANKEILLRRLSLDLTGLPPSLTDIENFVTDNSPNAYEKQVDRLLASPRYGEQMALDWMDLSRFADTHGYSTDRYRDMSPWRDWVISAFNKNLNYKDFVTWQLAGDLIENPTQETKLATAFNRNHPQNMEGGIVNEEFLVEYAVDRVSTAGQAFMGLTVACARCHDHKYDPVSQKEFYEMTAYFNNLNESGQISFNNAMPVPTLMLTSEEEEKMIQYMEGLIHKKEKEIAEVENSTIASDFLEWSKKNNHRSNLKKQPSNGLIAYYKLDDERLRNHINPSQSGTMRRENGAGKEVVLTKGKQGKGIIFSGDTWLDLKKSAVFGRNDSFSVSVWANIPANLTDGNIFYQGNGAIIFNWRGYHLKIVDNKLELLMAHTAPDNSITKISTKGFPRDKWVNFTVTYDGSSKAKGLKVFLDGKEISMITQIDNLQKDILFRNGNEPGLQLGGRWRGKGIKNAVVDEIKVYNRELSQLEILQLAESEDVKNIASKPFSDLDIKEKGLLQSYYTKSISNKTKNQQKELTRIRKSYVDSVEKIKEIMTMRETKTPKPTFVLDRGIYDSPTEEVFPNVPSKVMPMPDSIPKNRLGLAQWLFHEDHPLTSRVAVNRYWQKFFGTGLVKTSEDFGNQGEMPSHPELLDWLALEFRKMNWDIKAFQKMIVMSNTYQQSSKASDKLLKSDPENRLLARGPSERLTGEMLRDNALAASGLLSDKIGGKSVKPYQPNGLWKVNGYNYDTGKGEDLYRRSLYTIWKRSVPHPTIATFDTPARDVCTSRRQETNTPLQALVLLNDPIYIETARVLGNEITSFDSIEKGITTIFRKLTGRSITDNELTLLYDLQKHEYKKFKDNPSKTKGWMNTGAFEIKHKKDAALVAANAVVASTIINSDASITKR